MSTFEKLILVAIVLFYVFRSRVASAAVTPAGAGYGNGGGPIMVQAPIPVGAGNRLNYGPIAARPFPVPL
jgi:hypothetical protein